ncbi:hypothetical protein Clacol_000022 [Clathrus columnatus]|uniref:Beta-xylanase n=1 Tax=Clathrus columnatus TaxID=1419009 RepID=A0AAV4ZWI4_9AGAM|nr:hypothetical protein Clacol_000022 [Clathrus columnatus]
MFMFTSLVAVSVLLVPFITAQSTGAGLNKLAKAAGKLYFGTATDNPELTDTPYIAILNNSNEFGQITPENSLKWDATEPNQGDFTFTEGDQIVNLAKQNGYVIRGHNLEIIQRVTNGQWTNETLTAVLQNHIATVAGRYKGQFHAWVYIVLSDVVNEPLNDDGSLVSDVFSEIIGPEYIAIALRAARAADPDVKLWALRFESWEIILMLTYICSLRYINDFGIEGPGTKATAMQNLVKSLKAQGVPIDGIGFESHFILNEIPEDIQQNIEAFVALGVEVAITELDIRMTLPSTAELLSQQQANYQTVIEACAAVSQCIGVTLWDFTDKPAYSGIVAGFQ